MKPVQYGRRTFSFTRGVAVHKSTSIIEKPMLGEDEQAFTARLARKYRTQQGTFEVVFKKGQPDYAIVYLSE